MVMNGQFQRRNTRSAKLTISAVQEIRRRYADGETQSNLARVFEVSLNQIGRIVRGESWQSAGDVVKRKLTAQESLAHILQMQGNGLLEPIYEEEKEPEPERPDDWREGLTNEEIVVAEKMIGFGQDCWRVRDGIIEKRKVENDAK